MTTFCLFGVILHNNLCNYRTTSRIHDTYSNKMNKEYNIEEKSLECERIIYTTFKYNR